MRLCYSSKIRLYNTVGVCVWGVGVGGADGEGAVCNYMVCSQALITQVCSITKILLYKL